MSADRIAEIRARLAAATPGPWQTITTDDPNERKRGIVYDGDPYGSGHAVCDSAEQHDAKLIAAAPADIAWLLAENERLTTRRAREHPDLTPDRAKPKSTSVR